MQNNFTEDDIKKVMEEEPEEEALDIEQLQAELMNDLGGQKYLFDEEKFDNSFAIESEEDHQEPLFIKEEIEDKTVLKLNKDCLLLYSEDPIDILLLNGTNDDINNAIEEVRHNPIYSDLNDNEKIIEKLNSIKETNDEYGNKLNSFIFSMQIYFKGDNVDVNKVLMDNIVKLIHDPKSIPDFNEVEKLFNGLNDTEKVTRFVKMIGYTLDLHFMYDIDEVLELAGGEKEFVETKKEKEENDLSQSSTFKAFFEDAKTKEEITKSFKSLFQASLKVQAVDEGFNIDYRTSNDIGNFMHNFLATMKLTNREFDVNEVRDYIDKEIDGVKESPKVLKSFYENLGVEKGHKFTNEELEACNKDENFAKDALDNYKRLNEIHAKRGLLFFLFHPNQNSAEKSAIKEMKEVLEKFNVPEEELKAKDKDGNVKHSTFGDKISEAKFEYENPEAYENYLSEKQERNDNRRILMQVVNIDKEDNVIESRKPLSQETQLDLKEKTEAMKVDSVSKVKTTNKSFEINIDGPDDF